FHRVSDFFDHILGLSDHYAADKSGQGLALMERLGLDPRSVLLVGDTTHDVEVAARMGVQVTLIAAGNQSLSKLQACGVPMLGSLEELLARIR
ncbi:MAG: HAD hydrolase-like protein, partial [Verrucomicrobia bacterium]|nr:HAD hydrolase-like protein [Verrucomicrobiota bacterium]